MARPKLGSSDTERLHVKITADEIAAIDDWRYANRVPSRSEAVRRLCKIALFVENELDQIVDVASDGVKILSDQAGELTQVHRQIVNPDTSNLLFSQDEVEDIFRLAIDHATVAEEGLLGLHSMLVTLYNVIAAIAESKTVRSGVTESQKRLAEAAEAVEIASAKQAERDENRYLVLVHMHETPEEQAAYQALPEGEQEEYLRKRIEALRDEEAADPEAFAERYNIPSFFWKKAGWRTRLSQRVKDNGGDE